LIVCASLALLPLLFVQAAYAQSPATPGSANFEFYYQQPAFALGSASISPFIEIGVPTSTSPGYVWYVAPVTGTLVFTINGYPVSVPYNIVPSIPYYENTDFTALTTALAAGFNASGSPVTAAALGEMTLRVQSKATGAATNYPITLANGSTPLAPLTYDHGLASYGGADTDWTCISTQYGSLLGGADAVMVAPTMTFNVLTYFNGSETSQSGTNLVSTMPYDGSNSLEEQNYLYAQISCDTSPACGSAQLVIDGNPGSVVPVGPTGRVEWDYFAQGLHAGTTHTIQVAFLGTPTYSPLTVTATTLTITQATPLIQWWLSGTSIAAGVPLSRSTQLNASPAWGESIDGTWTYTPPPGTTFAAGTYPLSVTFAPYDSTDYTTATATSTLYVSALTASSIILSADPYQVLSGGYATLTARVTPGATGAVQFYDGPEMVGWGWLTPSTGIATYSYEVGNGTSTGPHVLTAVYGGDTAYASSSSNSVTVTAYTSAPASVISNIYPYNGTPGATVITISGSGFGTSGTVTFSGVAGAPTAWSDGSITVMLPAGAVTGNVIVQSGGAYSNSYFYPVASSGGTTSSCTSANAPCTLYSYSIAGSGSASGYDSAGDVTGYIDTVNGTWTAGYDAIHRLTSVTSSLVGAMSWTYDDAGNRLSQTGAGGHQTSTIDPATNRIITSDYHSPSGSGSGITQASVGFTYDAAGNVTFDGQNDYAYDAEGQMCASQSALGGIMTQYLYDADGNRVAKGHSTYASGTLSCPDPSEFGSSYFALDIIYAGSQEYAADGITLLRTYVGGIDGSATIDQGTFAGFYGDGTHYQLSDWLGNRRVQVSDAGVVEGTYTNLPFGDGLAVAGDDSDKKHFTGKERDTETASANGHDGLDYFGARYDASNTGRFTSPDPSGIFLAKLDNPQSLNLYAYVGNNPLSLIDPSGLVMTCPFTADTSWTVSTYDSATGQSSSTTTTDRDRGMCFDVPDLNSTVDSEPVPQMDLSGQPLPKDPNKDKKKDLPPCPPATGGSVDEKKGIPPPSMQVNNFMHCESACMGGANFHATSTSDSHKPSDPHSQGNAVDGKINGSASQVMACGASCGAQYEQNEYTNPSPNSTGGHYHFQLVPGKGGATGPVPASCKVPGS
jgi:RHS repeat-associated protein